MKKNKESWDSKEVGAERKYAMLSIAQWIFELPEDMMFEAKQFSTFKQIEQLHEKWEEEYLNQKV